MELALAVIALLGYILRDPLRILIMSLVLRALGTSQTAIAAWALREAERGGGGDPPALP